MGNQDERERAADELEGASEDVEAHGLTGDGLAGENLADRSSEEADDVEGHMLGNQPAQD